MPFAFLMSDMLKRQEARDKAKSAQEVRARNKPQYTFLVFALILATLPSLIFVSEVQSSATKVVMIAVSSLAAFVLFTKFFRSVLYK